jgi:hypothetical protein
MLSGLLIKCLTKWALEEEIPSWVPSQLFSAYRSRSTFGSMERRCVRGWPLADERKNMLAAMHLDSRNITQQYFTPI